MKLHDNVIVSDFATADVRTLIEKHLYDLACLHSIDATNANKNSDPNDELKHSIQTIILSTACLEAFINQECIRILGQEFYRYDKGQIDIYGNPIAKNTKLKIYPRLESKWCEITERICNKKYDKGKQPFQGFHKLINLRNEILHYKAISSAPVYVPQRGNIRTEL